MKIKKYKKETIIFLKLAPIDCTYRALTCSLLYFIFVAFWGPTKGIPVTKLGRWVALLIPNSQM